MKFECPHIGLNFMGELGLGSNVSSVGDRPNDMGNFLAHIPLGASQIAVEVSANYEFTCVLLSNWDVKCWGDGACRFEHALCKTLPCSARMGVGVTCDCRRFW
jgi:hypothetical protein